MLTDTENLYLKNRTRIFNGFDNVSQWRVDVPLPLENECADPQGPSVFHTTGTGINTGLLAVEYNWIIIAVIITLSKHSTGDWVSSTRY